jgi:hypothetical protein
VRRSSIGNSTLRGLRLLVVVLVSAFLVSCARKGELLDRAQVAWDKEIFDRCGAVQEFLKNNPHHDQAADARFRIANIYYDNLNPMRRRSSTTFISSRLSKITRRARLASSTAECYVALGKRQEAINEYEGLLNTPVEGNRRRRVRLSIADLYYDLKDLGQALV